MSRQGSLSIERMCQLAQVSRAGFYRSLQEQTPIEEEMEVRTAIQQIVVEHQRRYGYRRVSAELRRRGMLPNHKRVARIMREDNLLAMQPKSFAVTTDLFRKMQALYVHFSKYTTALKNRRTAGGGCGLVCGSPYLIGHDRHHEQQVDSKRPDDQ